MEKNFNKVKTLKVHFESYKYNMVKNVFNTGHRNTYIEKKQNELKPLKPSIKFKNDPTFLSSAEKKKDLDKIIIYFEKLNEKNTVFYLEKPKVPQNIKKRFSGKFLNTLETIIQSKANSFNR